MLKGLTAQYLLRHSYPVKPGDSVLIHAAAGGVGLIACQWAHYLKATVIGTVSGDKKAALAAASGCDHPIVYTKDDFVARVKEHTHGSGVNAVYDSVGKDTFMASLDCLRRFGTMVSFGQSSGAVGMIDPLLLTKKGSLYLTRPTLMHHMDDPVRYRQNAAELFALVDKKIIQVHIGGRYALADARQAHIDLESRNTMGAQLLIP